MLALVQGMLPAVSVFFELGREAASVAVHGLRAFRIADILRHARLQSLDQVVECLDVLTEALERVHGDPQRGVLCARRSGPLPGRGGYDAQHPAAVAGDRGAAVGGFFRACPQLMADRALAPGHAVSVPFRQSKKRTFTEGIAGPENRFT